MDIFTSVCPEDAIMSVILFYSPSTSFWNSFCFVLMNTSNLLLFYYGNCKSTGIYLSGKKLCTSSKTFSIKLWNIHLSTLFVCWYPQYVVLRYVEMRIYDFYVILHVFCYHFIFIFPPVIIICGIGWIYFTKYYCQSNVHSIIHVYKICWPFFTFNVPHMNL